jgi:hypothetical protein
MSFDSDPYTLMNVLFTDKGEAGWLCESCGSEGPSEGAIPLSTDYVMQELRKTWFDHLRRSHKRYPRCTYTILVGKSPESLQPFRCTLPDNHILSSYEHPGSSRGWYDGEAELGAVDHEFDVSVKP